MLPALLLVPVLVGATGGTPKPAPAPGGGAAPAETPSPAPAPAPAGDPGAPGKSPPGGWVPLSAGEFAALQAEVQGHLEASMAATVAITSRFGMGSGVIVSEDGYVLTAGHISGDPGRRVSVILPDGQRLRGETLGLSHVADSGLVKIGEGGPWPHVPMGGDGSAVVGDWCFALGHPGGIDRDRGLVLRVGRIISLRRDMLRSDCRLLGGDSGGPLFNLRGEVIGIHSRIAEENDQNYHAPIASFKRDWDRLMAGEVLSLWPRREAGFLGVETRDSGEGVTIVNVIKGSAAARAALRPGDVVTHVNDEPIGSRMEFSMAIRRNRPGDLVTFNLVRESEAQTLAIKLEPRPEEGG